MRAIRWVVISLVALVGLFTAADFVLRAVAEGQVARSLQSNLELSKRPDVDLGGFPFLLRAIHGHLDSVDLHSTDLTAAGQPLRSVTLGLDDVRFSTAALISGGDTTVRFRSSRGRAELTGQDLSDALKRAGVNARIRLTDGRALADIPGIAGEVAVRVRVNGQSLVFRPTGLGVPVDLSVDLREVVPDLRLEDASIHGSLATVTFSLATRHLDV